MAQNKMRNGILCLIRFVESILLAYLTGKSCTAMEAMGGLTGVFKTSSLDCNAEGFAPVFEYSPEGETQEFKFDVTIGK